MKAINRFSLVAIALSTMLFFTTQLSGQNYWLGGTPGAEADWNTAQNWSQNRVPDWTDSEVIIPNVESQARPFPVVNSIVPEIAHLNVQGGAKVTITESGSLVINGGTTYNYGIINTGDVYNAGNLVIIDTALSKLAENRDNIHNRGVIAVYNSEDLETPTYVLVAQNL